MAERFIDYWLGDGACSAMPKQRRAAFAEPLQPNFHEWDAVLSERTPLAVWQALLARILVVSDAATRLPIREIVAIFAGACPRWSLEAIAEGGHMAPLTHPQVINPILCDVLDKAT